jgi:hypothetical protein
MFSLIVFMVAFGAGCITGVVVHFSWRGRVDDSPTEAQFLPFPADDLRAG